MKEGDVTIECTPDAAARFGKCERFCAGYELPKDVTLADVLGALRGFQKDFCGDACRKLGPYGGHWEECESASAILAAFTKEDG